jgi:hypothetical protein
MFLTREKPSQYCQTRMRTSKVPFDVLAKASSYSIDDAKHEVNTTHLVLFQLISRLNI